MRRLAVVWIAVAGCAPRTSVHAIVDPARVERVVVWEGRERRRFPERYAEVRGDAAAALVKCMVYARNDDAVWKIYGAVGAKPDADAVLVLTDGQPVHVAFAEAKVLFWRGGPDVASAYLEPPFADLYAALSWRLGRVPAASTRPTPP